MSEWKHLSSTELEKKKSEELWVIALGFLLYFPGLVLLWRYPFDSKGVKNRYRYAACTVVLPVIWAYAYLLYFVLRNLVSQVRRKLNAS